MLKEAIQFVFERGGEAVKLGKASIIDCLGNGRNVVVEHNGQLIERVTPPGLRTHQVDSVADLCNAAKRWKDDPVVWIDGDQVVLVADDGDRRDTVTLPLHKSAVFLAVEQLAKTSKLDQAQLIRLLRAELREAVGVSVLMTAVRKIKFRSSAQGHAEIQHGNESMGREIENEVVGVDQGIPESLMVVTHVYKNPGETEAEFNIALGLEILVVEQKFRLAPMPDEIELAVDMALAGIRERIEQALPGVPVFFGRP